MEAPRTVLAEQLLVGDIAEIDGEDRAILAVRTTNQSVYVRVSDEGQVVTLHAPVGTPVVLKGR